MKTKPRKLSSFDLGLKKLGFFEDKALIFIDKMEDVDVSDVTFHLETARFIHKDVTAIYFRKQLNGNYKPQVYIYDYTKVALADQIDTHISEIQRRIWSSGEVPLACFFFNSEIKIVDCTEHLTKDLKPVYLIDKLQIAGEIHSLFNEQFAVKIKSGLFWDQNEVSGRFEFKNSSYDTLIQNIRIVISKLSKELEKAPKTLINKLIIQSILIKYLEETADDEGKKLLSDKFFKKYDSSNSFGEVLKKGMFVQLLNDLNRNFNGNVFNWQQDEQEIIKSLDLSIVAKLLATDKTNLESAQIEIGFPDWRYFEFKYVPVELISRLYEEFLGENKKDNGLFYTPSHLAKMLVDECLPLKKYSSYNLANFKVLDPACGSGIFLVTAFKRLVQIWRLQNGLKKPGIYDLKKLLRCLYGIDKEEQAVLLSSFSLSLALCNELKPIEVINKLKFDDLTKENLIASDFFMQHHFANRSFDIVIGNPPFARGAITNYTNSWVVDDKKVQIPQGQIALKFLSESFSLAKEGGLICLIIKSSGLLYNSTSSSYKRLLFSQFEIAQVLDFTALARNKSLWDGADVATAAIFVLNQKPDFKKNILHLTFRRTKATNERIFFEIDEYDLHFFSKQDAIENDFIWKINLLGGGRVRNLVEKLKVNQPLVDHLKANDSFIEEGFEIGSKKRLSPKFIYDIPFLPTKGISEHGINLNNLQMISPELKFTKIPRHEVFLAPNLIIWENVGERKFPIFLNSVDFSFQRRIVGIKSSKDDIIFLNKILESFRINYEFYKFYILATSSETLINRNNTFLLKDLKKLPFLAEDFKCSNFDLRVVSDCNSYLQDFFIHGENSIALQPVPSGKIRSFTITYGEAFCSALNSVFGREKTRFRLAQVVNLRKSSLIAVVFKYDSSSDDIIFEDELSDLDIKKLIVNEISNHLSMKRVIKIYHQRDTIVFVKPNQQKYWLSLIAYRDADKCFLDFSNQINE